MILEGKVVNGTLKINTEHVPFIQTFAKVNDGKTYYMELSLEDRSLLNGRNELTFYYDVLLPTLFAKLRIKLYHVIKSETELDSLLCSMFLITERPFDFTKLGYEISGDSFFTNKNYAHYKMSNNFPLVRNVHCLTKSERLNFISMVLMWSRLNFEINNVVNLKSYLEV